MASAARRAYDGRYYGQEKKKTKCRKKLANLIRTSVSKAFFLGGFCGYLAFSNYSDLREIKKNKPQEHTKND